MAETPPLLSVESLSVEFARRGTFSGLRRQRSAPFRAVDCASFDIAPGETLGLVGESGSGKTTIGRAILGLNRPTSGRIRFNGVDIVDLPRKERPRRIQMVFQDPYGSLNPRFTVRRTLAEVLRFHQIVPPAQIENELYRIMELVGLQPELAERQPHHLSGGQRQRVGLARALAVRPELLVLDEPVAALDVSIQAQVLNLLHDLQRTLDLTMLFIAHDLGVVRYISDRIAVICRGVIREIASADTLFSNPRDEYTQRLLAAVPPALPRGMEPGGATRDAWHKTTVAE